MKKIPLFIILLVIYKYAFSWSAPFGCNYNGKSNSLFSTEYQLLRLQDGYGHAPYGLSNTSTNYSLTALKQICESFGSACQGIAVSYVFGQTYTDYWGSADFETQSCWGSGQNYSSLITKLGDVTSTDWYYANYKCIAILSAQTPIPAPLINNSARALCINR